MRAAQSRTSGVRVGNTVFLDGQLGYEDGRMVPSCDPLAQAAQCFANVDKGLESFGASRRDVVKLVCYLADIAHLAHYQQSRKEFLGSVRVAVTTVVVAGLAHPDAIMEVEATAVIASQEQSVAPITH